jgi:CRISPR-associated protein Cas1
MQACAQGGVTISLLNPFGGFRAAIVGFTPGNVLQARFEFNRMLNLTKK